MAKKELTKKKWALMFIPYGSMIHSLTFPYDFEEDGTPSERMDTNVYISEEIARTCYEEKWDRLEVVTLERVRKPKISAFINIISKQYGFKDSSMTFEEMIKIDFENTTDSDLCHPDVPLLMDLFEVVEV